MKHQKIMKTLVPILFVLLICFCCNDLMARNPLETLLTPNPPPSPAPINGFIGIALAVGAYFGAKKLRKDT